MKHTAALLLGMVLSTLSVVCAQAQDSSVITGATWMSLSRDARLGFVAGYMDGLQLMSNKFDLNLAPVTRNGLTATDWNNQLYENLLKQPELRKQPVGELLYKMIEGGTDGTGRKSDAAAAPGK